LTKAAAVVVIAMHTHMAWGEPTATPPATAPTPPHGLAVVAIAGATDAAWPLAQAIYANPNLRADVRDAEARVLCGEPAPPASPESLKDLGETVSALRAEDAGSRALLADISRRLRARALVVVHMDRSRPLARIFLPETAAFDAATYHPDGREPSVEMPGPAPAPTWSDAAQSIARFYAPSDAPLKGPALATQSTPPVKRAEPAHPFYESPWFWAGVGAAALAGGAFYLGTRDSGPKTIHLDVQVP
jgi:hypothetical protein